MCFLLVSSNCNPSSSERPDTGKESRLGNNHITTTAGTGGGNKTVNHSRSSQKPAKGLGNKMSKPKDAGTQNKAFLAILGLGHFPKYFNRRIFVRNRTTHVVM